MTAPSNIRPWIATAFLVLLAGCGFARSTQAIEVTMGEGPWTVEPATVDDANQFDFTFVNRGAEAHSPIVVVLVGDETVEAGRVVARAIGSDAGGGGAGLVYPAGDSGRTGHFHPGDPDEPRLPAVAVTVEEDGGDLIRYLFTDTVGPDDALTGSVTAGKPEFTFGSRNPSTRYAVLCMDPSHAQRGEHVVFELVR